jgi:hypothetical protein
MGKKYRKEKETKITYQPSLHYTLPYTDLCNSEPMCSIHLPLFPLYGLLNLRGGTKKEGGKKNKKKKTPPYL